MTGALVLIATLAVATVAGLLYRARYGRIRRSQAAGIPETIQAWLDGSPVTLLQLSTTFCAPCRHTRVLLSDLAERTPGVRHLDLDLAERPELADRLRVHRTPTTLALDSSGREVFRFTGVPKRDALISALRAHLPA